MAKIRPVIVVTVSGGVAEVQVMPPGEDIEVLIVDYDNLESPEITPEQVKDVIEQVKELPGKSSGAQRYRDNLLQDLDEALARATQIAKDQE